MHFRTINLLQSYVLLFALALIVVITACNNSPEPTAIPAVQTVVSTATQVASTQTSIPTAPTELPTVIPTVHPPTRTATAVVPTPTSVVIQELPSPRPVPTMNVPTSVVNLDDVQADLHNNRQKWNASGIENYRFDYRNICFCIRDYVNPVTIEIYRGTIISATVIESGESVNEEGFQRYKTVEALFDLIQDAIDRNVHRITLSYNNELGYPTWGSIDYDPRIADEEFGFSSDNLIETETSDQASDVSIDGHWEGAIDAITGSLDIQVDFVTRTDGEVTAALDIPAQGVEDFPITDISLVGSKLSFEIVEFGASFSGSIEGDTISGEFSQSGLSMSLDLRRSEVDEFVTVLPLPYDEQEVTFQNGDVTLSGTLSLPSGDGSHPAVVLLTGSGPQNRDENIFGFKLFVVLADHLTRQGVAVLRYDDRGVGGSTGNLDDATLEDLAMDSLAAVELLRNHSRINAEQIGFLGHSEGGVTGPMAAAQSERAAFVIMMAGPTTTLEKILIAQSRLILEANGASEEQIQAQQDLQNMLFKAIRTGEGWDTVEAETRQQIRAGIEELPTDQRDAIGDVDEFVESVLQPQLQASKTPSFRYFLDYDPAPTLEELTFPVLALFGGLDLQVPAKINGELAMKISESSENSDFTIETFPKANHLFQEALTGSPTEYTSLEKAFIPGFLDTISDWLLARVDIVTIE